MQVLQIATLIIQRIVRGSIIGVLCASILSALAIACGSGSRPPAFTQKMVILGFEGLDPDLTERWIAEGRLPNLAKLASRGGLHRLETTPSVEAASAWASFATGVNPGKHNVYDVLTRDARTYVPRLAMMTREPAQFLFDAIPWSPPVIATTRGGTSFWVTAGRAGVRSSILTVPVTFPPEKVPNGELLAGLPLPDVRGTMGAYSYFGTDLSREQEGVTEFGGVLRRLVLDRRIAQAEIVGPPNPIVEQRERRLRKQGVLSESDRVELADLSADAHVRVPLAVTWNREARTANIDIQGQLLHLRERQWSRWVDVEFRVNLFVRVRGMLQFFLVNAGQHLQLYATPVHWHPANPPSPISWPPAFASELFERLGPYRTLGWPEATGALADERIDDAAFLEDLGRAFDDRAQTILSRIDGNHWNLLVGVVDATDRVQHMFWRLIDPEHPMYDAELARLHGGAIRRMYERADELTGQVLARVPPDTAVLVVSDHGFHAFRWAVNLNTWLVQHGYMTLKERGSDETKKADDLVAGGAFLERVDWSRTVAYAMGLGQIYVNLAGREGQGVVSDGAPYEALLDRLAADLRKFTDPRSGAAVVRRVYKRADIYRGPYISSAPDVQVSFENGYRVSWQTALGGVPSDVIEPNMRKWSGDHASLDYRASAGVLLSSVRPTSDATRLIDIAPTVLKFFGLSVPTDIDGKPLF